MVVAAAILKAIADALHSLADALLWCADALTGGARLVLRCSSLCLDRAREWDPRLWDRDRDPRSDTRERRP